MKKGPLFIFISAVLFSLGGLCVKMIPWSGLAINGARSLVSLSVLAVYLIVIRHRLKLNKYVLLGSACLFATNTLFTLANKMTTAANTIVLQFTAPVFIMLLMWLFFREKPVRLDLAACAVVLGGIVFFFVDSLSAGGMLGNLLAILSGVTYAGVFMMDRYPDSDPISSVFFGQLAAAVLELPFLAFETDFSFTPILFVLILGMFQMGAGYLFFTNGIKRTPPVAASLISGIEPILNPVWVALFYGESMGPAALIGGVIVVGGILTYNVLKEKRASASKQKSA